MERDVTYYRIVDKSAASVADIYAAAEEAWRDMVTPGTRSFAAAEKAGIDLTTLPERMEEAVEIRPYGAGVGSVELVVVGILGKMAYDAWKDIWKHILFPRIKKAYAIEPIEPPKLARKKVPAKKAVE